MNDKDIKQRAQRLIKKYEKQMNKEEDREQYMFIAGKRWGLKEFFDL